MLKEKWQTIRLLKAGGYIMLMAFFVVKWLDQTINILHLMPKDTLIWKLKLYLTHMNETFAIFWHVKTFKESVLLAKIVGKLNLAIFDLFHDIFSSNIEIICISSFNFISNYFGKLSFIHALRFYSIIVHCLQ